MEAQQYATKENLIYLQPDSSRKKKQETPNESNHKRKVDITTNTTEIQRTRGDYYEQLYANKKYNLEAMGIFFERYNLPRLSQKEIKKI